MIQPTNAVQPYPQTGGANAVSINIFNPQAYGSAPAANNNMQAPYQLQNSLYNMPVASAYTQTMPEQPYRQLMPMQNPIVQQPSALIAPAPQLMPESVMPQAVAVEAQPQQMQAVENTEVQPQTIAEPQKAVENVEVQQPQNNIPIVNTDELIQGLKNADADMKAETINKIAAYAQETPEIALQIVSEPIMNSLVEVIKEDTTGLEGPTAQQIQVAEKITKGEKLTAEEEALSEQLSPRDKANKNRIFALYTLAMIQKLQRDELDQYIETQKANGQQAIAPLKIEDLVGYNDIANVINNDARPEVKVAAIQAVQYVANADDKATVEALLANSLNSNDEAIKTAATEAMAKFAA